MRPAAEACRGPVKLRLIKEITLSLDMQQTPSIRDGLAEKRGMLLLSREPPSPGSCSSNLGWWAVAHGPTCQLESLDDVMTMVAMCASTWRAVSSA